MTRYNVTKLMDRKPTKIGEVLGIDFYEHPTLGDDVGMIAVHEGLALQTDWYDIPRVDDVITPAEFMGFYSGE